MKRLQEKISRWLRMAAIYMAFAWVVVSFYPAIIFGILIEPLTGEGSDASFYVIAWPVILLEHFG